jgi:hypothetical protein
LTVNYGKRKKSVKTRVIRLIRVSIDQTGNENKIRNTKRDLHKPGFEGLENGVKVE